MKLSEIKQPTKGKWKIGNLSGHFKNFASEESPDAQKWMRNRGGADQVWDGVSWVENPKKAEREDREAERDRKREEKEQRDWDNRNNPTDKELKDLYNRGIEAISSSFPDGDPIDHMLPYLRRRDWTTDQIDQAFKKYGHGGEKKGFYAAVASMWDDFSGDTIADANADLKAGRKPDSNSVFFTIKDGKVVPTDNPWK